MWYFSSVFRCFLFPLFLRLSLPYEHRIASLKYLINRVHKYATTNKAKTKELNIIQDTLCNNKYNGDISISHSRNHKHNKNTSPQKKTTKRAIFTYYGKETKEITRFFKERNIKIEFWTKTHCKT
jgi:hypothetical protein